ncbi:hypothetical protein ACS8FA_07340 [Psychrobacter sp. 1Y1]|uniref:hypothetical protein n=1 Tax=Psychrobacter sp. 1Y1 TaxID=3453574 RepID=UPI003F44B85F
MLLGNGSKDAMLNGLASFIEAATMAVIDVYAGSDVLVQLVMPENIVKSVQDGVITLNVAEQALVVKTGQPDTAKLVINGVVEIELTVGIDLLLDDTTLYKGGYFKITELSINI